MWQAVAFFLGTLPTLYIFGQVWVLLSGGPHRLGADPARELVLFQGEWAIHFLVLTLLVTPVRRLTGWAKVGPLRRTLGLFTFFYATLHLLSYIFLLLELEFMAIGRELVERPYIAAGLLAWLFLVPLALTSTREMAKRLGRSWRKLHRLIYCIALLAILHVVWLAKSSYLEAIIYGLLLLLSLGFRLFVWKGWLSKSGLKALD